MNDNTSIVLRKLKHAGTTGITHWDFASGFALRSRIADLRRRGIAIETRNEPNANNKGTHARYVLVDDQFNTQFSEVTA